MSKVVFGKELLTTLSELVSPKHTALVIVDAQNDFCSPGGCIAQLDPAITRIMEPYIQNSAKLLAAARQAGLLIIYMQATNHSQGIFKSGPDILRKIEYLHPDRPLICVEETWGHQIVDRLKPLPHEIIIKKRRHNSFVGTELDILLRSNGIKSLIITGVTTERCVLGTVTGAIAHDYYVVVPKDCVAAPNIEMHHAALLVIRGNLCKEGMTESGTIIKIWEG